MARRSAHSFLLASALALGAALTGCHAGSPELRVVGLHQEPLHDVVFVQVTNSANHVMRLTKLEYTFAADGAKVSEGEVALARDVPAGTSIVVEVPMDAPSEKPMTLSGTLTTELNDIEQTFSVSAKVDPSKLEPPKASATLEDP
jgi:hypothetical protein